MTFQPDYKKEQHYEFSVFSSYVHYLTLYLLNISLKCFMLHVKYFKRGIQSSLHIRTLFYLDYYFSCECGLPNISELARRKGGGG